MEIFDIYNIDREKTGRTMIRGEKTEKGDFRLVVHACIFNSKGQMLIQQRQPFKEGWPNMWDVSVGGSAIAGETSRDAVKRELSEELGIEIDVNCKRPHLTINFEGAFDDFYIFNEDIDINSLKLQYEEVQAVRWAFADEIIEMINEGVFIPYYENYIKLLFDMRERYGAANIKN
jgi:isopentenyldiphosphate isomerase